MNILLLRKDHDDRHQVTDEHLHELNEWIEWMDSMNEWTEWLEWMNCMIWMTWMNRANRVIHQIKWVKLNELTLIEYLPSSACFCFFFFFFCEWGFEENLGASVVWSPPSPSFYTRSVSWLEWSILPSIHPPKVTRYQIIHLKKRSW